MGDFRARQISDCIPFDQQFVGVETDNELNQEESCFYTEELVACVKVGTDTLWSLNFWRFLAVVAAFRPSDRDTYLLMQYMLMRYMVRVGERSQWLKSAMRMTFIYLFPLFFSILFIYFEIHNSDRRVVWPDSSYNGFWTFDLCPG